MALLERKSSKLCDHKWPLFRVFNRKWYNILAVKHLKVDNLATFCETLVMLCIMSMQTIVLVRLLVYVIY